MKKFNYVYLITNNINGKIYVGVHSTDNLMDGYMGSGVLISKAIEKYGVENFTKEIIRFCDNIRDAYDLESIIVDEKFTKDNLTYNMRTGGCNKQKYYWTEEQKENLRKSRPYHGELNPNYGNGYKQSGRRNGRHHTNFSGDIKEVGSKISTALKKSNKNKKSNNPASKIYHISTPNKVINIRKGMLHSFCDHYGMNYNIIFSTLRSRGKISKSKYVNCVGCQLFEGWSDNYDEIF